jgi:NADPH:quinone reductase-like Zn-dependent oxidoreductase
MANPRLYDMLRSVFTPLLTDKTVTFAFAGETEEELLALKTMIEAEEIKPIVDEIYPMEQAAEAHRRVEAEQRLGTIVIAITQ